MNSKLSHVLFELHVIRDVGLLFLTHRFPFILVYYGPWSEALTFKMFRVFAVYQCLDYSYFHLSHIAHLCFVFTDFYIGPLNSQGIASLYVRI